MKYNVLEEFELDGVTVEAGTVWIPAETGVKQHIVDAKVAAGTVELIVPEVPTDEVAEGDDDAPKRRKKFRR